jgi:hypothetical protein
VKSLQAAEQLRPAIAHTRSPDQPSKAALLSLAVHCGNAAFPARFGI